MATFWNKKKDWFSHKTGLVFVHGHIFKDGSRNSITFKIELFATISNGRVYNQWTVVFACCCGNSTIFTGKIKIRWKWPCLEGTIRYDFLFCRHVFAFFWKSQLLSVSLTSCFILKINYKTENWYHCWFHLPGFYYLKQPWKYVLKNAVNKMQENSCERVLKLKTETF